MANPTAGGRLGPPFDGVGGRARRRRRRTGKREGEKARGRTKREGAKGNGRAHQVAAGLEGRVRVHAARQQRLAPVGVDVQLRPRALLHTEAVQIRHLFAGEPRDDEQVFAVEGGEEACAPPPGRRHRGQLGPGEGRGVQAVQFTEAPRRPAAPEHVQLVPDGRHDMERPGAGHVPLRLQDLPRKGGQGRGGGMEGWGGQGQGSIVSMPKKWR